VSSLPENQTSDQGIADPLQEVVSTVAVETACIELLLDRARPADVDLVTYRGLRRVVARLKATIERATCRSDR